MHLSEELLLVVMWGILLESRWQQVDESRRGRLREQVGVGVLIDTEIGSVVVVESAKKKELTTRGISHRGLAAGGK